MMQNHTATQTPELAALPLRSVLKATRVNYKVTVEYVCLLLLITPAFLTDFAISLSQPRSLQEPLHARERDLHPLLLE